MEKFSQRRIGRRRQFPNACLTFKPRQSPGCIALTIVLKQKLSKKIGRYIGRWWEGEKSSGTFTVSDCLDNFLFTILLNAHLVSKENIKC